MKDCVVIFLDRGTLQQEKGIFRQYVMIPIIILELQYGIMIKIVTIIHKGIPIHWYFLIMIVFIVIKIHNTIF